MSGSDRFLLAHDRVVQAGAGTGKTHALLTQYLHLVAGVTAYRRAIPPSQICALTFTEKAAAEMRERLTSRVTTDLSSPGRGKSRESRRRLARQ
jgi:ATP-dependent helicase/nuclease subunit A